MATRVFADEELERLREFPGIGRDELFRHFTLTGADRAFVDPGRGRGAADLVGLSRSWVTCRACEAILQYPSVGGERDLFEGGVEWLPYADR